MVIQYVLIAGAASSMVNVLRARRDRCTHAHGFAVARPASRFEARAVALHGGHAESLEGLIATTT